MQERQIKVTFTRGDQKVVVKNIVCHQLSPKSTMGMEESGDAGLDESPQVRGFLCWPGNC